METEEKLTEEALREIVIEDIAGIEIRKYKTPANEMTRLEVDIWNVEDEVNRYYGDSTEELTIINSWIQNNDLEGKTMRLEF